MKWLLVKNFFRAYLSFYALYLLSLTCLVLTKESPVVEDKVREEDRETLLLVSYILTIITVSCLVIKNVILLIYNWRLYVTNAKNFTEVRRIFYSSIRVAIF